MNPQPAAPQAKLSSDEQAVRALYRGMLESWNHRTAQDIAALYTEDGHMVGFDGSVIDGQAQIKSEMSRIFADHQTGLYYGKVREVRFLTPDSALLRAVSGMIPHGQGDLKPELNTIQSLVAVKQDGKWHIALYHNTPAQFHGRPDLAQQLTEELRQLL